MSHHFPIFLSWTAHFFPGFWSGFSQLPTLRPTGCSALPAALRGHLAGAPRGVAAAGARAGARRDQRASGALVERWSGGWIQMADTYDGWLIFHDAYVNYEFLCQASRCCEFVVSPPSLDPPLNNRIFFRLYIVSTRQLGIWENSRKLCKHLTASRVCITVSNSSNPPHAL